VRSFLAENYNILAALFTQKIINQFIEEIKFNTNYENYYIDWFNKSEKEKVK
jgi:hypothetical protein